MGHDGDSSLLGRGTSAGGRPVAVELPKVAEGLRGLFVHDHLYRDLLALLDQLLEERRDLMPTIDGRGGRHDMVPFRVVDEPLREVRVRELAEVVGGAVPRE